MVERNSGKRKIGKEREKDTIREGKRNYSEKFIHQYQIKHTAK